MQTYICVVCFAIRLFTYFIKNLDYVEFQGAIQHLFVDLVKSRFDLFDRKIFYIKTKYLP
jgi:hypothetical protein